MTQSTKFQRCMVMAGGGFHFGYYLGVYAAMRESGNEPDILLASCGGAIAAAIIQALPTDAERKAWLSAPQMYHYWRGLQAKAGASLLGSFAGAMRRRYSNGNAMRMADLFNDYMFEIPAQLPLPPVRHSAAEVSVAIVAGKLLYGQHEVGLPRGQRKLFAETIFCDPRSAALLNGMSSPLHAIQFGDNAIAEKLLTDVSMPLGDAVRASIADMFYFRCHSHGNDNYIGGVVDLFPIEVASQLAQQVIMEVKSGYDKTYALPAIRNVLGFDGNQRLKYVLDQSADLWFDTSDMEAMFAKQAIKQKILWHKNQIQIVTPDSYESYVDMIEAQWQYGYRRGLAAL